jgi:hypothetical protein
LQFYTQNCAVSIQLFVNYRFFNTPEEQQKGENYSKGDSFVEKVGDGVKHVIMVRC